MYIQYLRLGLINVVFDQKDNNTGYTFSSFPPLDIR